MSRRAVRLATWVLTVTVAGLSLLPPALLGTLPAGGGGYHILAYFVLALGFSFSSVEPRAGRIVAALAAYGALLELLQFLVPGRTPEMIDVVANSLGAALGAIISQIILRRWSRSSGGRTVPLRFRSL